MSSARSAPFRSLPGSRARLGRILTWLFACSLLASCTTFGGRQVRLKLVTEPPGAEAFVVSQEHWYSKGKSLYEEYTHASGEPRGDALRALLDWLDSFRIRSAPTNVDVVVVAHQQVFLAQLEEALEYTEFDPLALPVDPSDWKKFVKLEFRHGGASAP